MVRTEVHLSIGGMSGPYLFEPQPSENVRVGKACNLQAVKLKISHCIVLITKR